MKKLSIAIAATLLLALSPAGAQESPDTAPNNTPHPQLTLQIQDQTPRRDNNQKVQGIDQSRVREARPRPHGRSRVDPAPPERPLIDPKRM